VVFAAIGVTLLAAGVVLAVLGSFAYVAVLSIGLFFIAAALAARAISSPARRAAALLALASAVLLTFGMVATPLFYAGWGLLAGAAALALVAARQNGPTS
jgi:hypothetical protein